MSLSGGQLAGGNSTTEKADNDFYATNPQTVREFLNQTFYEFEDVKTIWENACGEGHLSDVLKEYFDCKFIDTDLIDRNYCKQTVDFLNSDFNPNADLIITNPPFSLVNDFIVKEVRETAEEITKEQFDFLVSSGIIKKKVKLKKIRSMFIVGDDVVFLCSSSSKAPL